MSKQILGRLISVDPRSYWENEASHFTPWLANEDNLALLGDTIGIELELESVEKDVGPYRADIVCRDTATDTLVLVENQLERTDHKHLGQVLMYGAGLNAVTIVWIADQFTDEHRATLDWLNEITDEDINFFGLEIELWKIGDSPLAPKFNVVSMPNDWIKFGSSGHAAKKEITPTKQLQLEYWGAFRDYITTNSTIIKPRKPLPQHWYNFAIGRSKFRLQTFANTVQNRIGVELVMTGPYAKPHYYLLEEQKDEIEAELGFPLMWRELPTKIASRLTLRKPDTDPKKKSDWPEQHQWLLEKLERVHNVFSPRILALDAGDYVEEDEEEVDEV
jgi:hypothetical protein